MEDSKINILVYKNLNHEDQRANPLMVSMVDCVSFMVNADALSDWILESLSKKLVLSLPLSNNPPDSLIQSGKR